MHHDGVGPSRELRRLHEIAEPALHPIVEPALVHELPGRVLVLGRELEVRRPFGARLQKLELDRPDAAADLQHRCALDAAITQERDHLRGGVVEALLAITLRVPSGGPLGKEPRVPARRLAAAHR